MNQLEYAKESLEVMLLTDTEKQELIQWLQSPPKEIYMDSIQQHTMKMIIDQTFKHIPLTESQCDAWILYFQARKSLL